MTEKKIVNKKEFIDALSESTNFSKKDLLTIIDAEQELLAEILGNGDSFKLIGFGMFEVRERAARKGRNPQTGEEIAIPESRIVAFKPGKKLKDVLKQPKL